jgi:RNA polymerase sigma-70 factor (ECF subfamily)
LTTPGEPTRDPDRGTSLTLLCRLRDGDEAAWARLVYLYGPLVRHWAGRRGVTGADADDVAQEVFRAVAAGLDGFRRDRPGDTFRGWLCGVTRLVLLRHAEQSRRQPRADGGTDALRIMQALPDLPDEDDPPTERAALYRRGLELVRGEFEVPTWQMFWGVVVDGRAPADVAAERGVSPAAVRQAKSRVLRRLKEELGEVLDRPPFG